MVFQYLIINFYRPRVQKTQKSSVFYSVVSSVLVILCCAETLYAILIANFSPYLSNYSHYGWSESFEKTIDELEKSYILRDWKQIDFDSLRSELIPRVEKAEKDNDVEEFELALYELKFYLNDGHVWVSGSDYSALNNVEMSFCGNDYGFSMFRDNTGKILAVLTEESSEAEKYGIHDGIQITKWNCETVDEAAAKVRCFDTEYNFSYVENEEIFQPVFLAGKGGDTVNVSFIDDNGDEKTVSLNKTGNYNSRLRKAIRKIYGYEIITSENLFTCMLNEKCGYLRVSNEALYGSDIKEILAMMNGEYPEFREEMENKIQKLEDQGMDRMIIDIRNNTGGYDVLSRTIASLFVEKPVVDECGYYKNGKYGLRDKPTLLGAAKWKDIPVVVLVNGETCSSGDCLAYWLSQGENVQLFGNTYTWGNAQSIGGVIILSDDLFEFRYPIFPSLSIDYEPIVDPKSDRKSRIKLDFQITYDKEEVIRLFSDSAEDDVLNQALDYIMKEN